MDKITLWALTIIGYILAVAMFLFPLIKPAHAQINCADTGGQHLNYLIATHQWVCGTSTGASSLSSLTAAAAANSINNGDNAQTWNWALTTATKSAFLIKENTAAINGIGSQFLVDIQTLPNSTAIPFRVNARGLGNNIEVSRLGSLSLFGADIAIRTDPNDITITTGLNRNINLESSVGSILRINGTTEHTTHMGTSPTMGACGTSPSVIGKDEAMLVTVGTGGSATSCAVTFAKSWTNAPVCIAQNDTDRVAYSMVTTTTTLTITATAAFTASSKFHVVCRGFE